jgi:hypothetical protein
MLAMLARKHYDLSMKQKAPITTPIVTGAEIRTAPKSAQPQGDFTDDVLDLPNRSEAPWA